MNQYFIKNKSLFFLCCFSCHMVALEQLMKNLI